MLNNVIAQVTIGYTYPVQIFLVLYDSIETSGNHTVWFDKIVTTHQYKQNRIPCLTE